jgi:uncharacterized protein RhaS with RHS repeats
MGARLYNPTTGLFTSPDPITGGNTTPYTYPQNPINSNDLDGLIAWAKIGKGIQKGAKWLTDSKAGKAINIACGFTFGVVSAACTGVYATAYLVQGRFGEAANEAVWGAVGGGVKAIVKSRTIAKQAKAIKRTAKSNPPRRSNLRKQVKRNQRIATVTVKQIKAVGTPQYDRRIKK